MALNQQERKKMNAFLRRFFANNRVTSFCDIIHSLKNEEPKLEKRLRKANKRLSSEAYLARYYLTKFVKEGWLKVSGDCIEVQLSPERCSYCFQSIEDVYVIDIDRNRYCGWHCAEKCHYYSPPYESNLDTYHFLFDDFARWLPKCRRVLNEQTPKNVQELKTLIKTIEAHISDIQYDDFRSPHKNHNDVDREIHRMLVLLYQEVQKLKSLLNAESCIDKRKIILCKQCIQPINKYYLINHRGDYFCGEECHEIFHRINAEQFIDFDEDHPYHFDYSSIREEYIYWSKNWVNILQERTEGSNAHAQRAADDLIDELDEIIWDYKDYIFTEGDDGVFAYEIYQYTLKLGEIQQQILKWRPERETYYALCCYYDNYDEIDTPEIISDCLNEVAEKEGLALIKNEYQRPHPFHEYFDWIFDFESERDYWFDILLPYFQSKSLYLSTYTAHLCDGGCNDYLDITDTDMSNGWFYCESCLHYWNFGEMTLDELMSHLQYYETHQDELQAIIHDKWGNHYGYKSTIRRSCRIHQIDIPSWAAI